MEEKILFKKVFNRYWAQQHRDRSHLSDNNSDHYDGTHPIFNLVAAHKDEETFRKNLKDPLYSVFQETITIVVEERVDKVSFKVFFKSFNRKVGKTYFKLKRDMSFITVNKKFGNIYFGKLHNYQNKKKFTKSIRSNSFIKDQFDTFIVNLKSLISSFNVDESSKIIFECSRIFLNQIDGGVQGITIGDRLFKFYLDKKNIKYPNNFMLFSKVLNKEFRDILKKNENKIIDSYMVQNKIFGKKIKKVLHTVEDLNVDNLKTGLKLFGSDWIHQENTLIRDIFNNKIQFTLEDNLIDSFNELASPKEKRRAFSIYKAFNTLNEIDGWTLRDHFRFYVNLKRYGDTEVEWKSDGLDYKKLAQEHLDWTDKLSFYRKGEYQRKYPQRFFETLKSFNIQNREYFPVLLTNTSEYNEESSIQSNCVRTYIGKPSSLIVSLRKGSDTSQERLTVEYKVSKTPKLPIVYINRVQTRATHNSRPEDFWEKPLEILDELMGRLLQNNTFETYKLSKKCSNGVELESETNFNELGKLVWTYDAIDNEMNPSNYILFH